MCVSSRFPRVVLGRQLLAKIRGLGANPTLVAAMTFIAMLVISAIFTWNEHLDDKQQRRFLAEEITSHYARSLEHQVNHTLTSLHYIALLVRPDGAEVENFPQIAARLAFLYQGISELHLVTKNRAGAARPALSYRNTDRVLNFPELERLLRDPFQALASPGLESKVIIDQQGDVAILGYLPAFSGSIQSTQLKKAATGVTVTLLRMRDVAESAGLLHLTALGYDYELQYIDDAGKYHPVVSSSSAPQQPLLRQFSTAEQLWELRVAPSSGWVAGGTLAKYVLFMAAISILSAMLANMIARLVRAQVTLRASEQRFRDLTELSSDWWWEQDEHFRFVAVSPAHSYAGLAVADHIGKTRWELANTSLPRKESWDSHIETLRKHEPFRNLIIERRLNDEIRLLKVSGKPLFAADGRFIGYRGAASDITEEFHAQQAVRESEANFRGIFNVVPDPLIVRDEFDVIRQINPAACRFFGAHQPGDLLGKNWYDLYPPEEKAAAIKRSRLLVQPHTPLPVAKRRFLRLDGRIIVGESTALMLVKREGRRVLTVIHDSSEREAVAKQYEMLQHELTRQVIATREQERRALSIELHDRVGQTLTAARFNLDFLREQIPEDARPLVEDGLTNVHDLLRTMSSHVRDLMADLHPPALDDHGLRTALAFHLDNMAQRTSIETQIHGLDFKPRLPQDKALMLFRIAQEALHNILKHANCTRALVSLSSDDREFRMSIADNGVGFDPSQVNSSKFGLRIMRERAESIGARLEILQVKDLGTQIIVTLDKPGVDQTAA
jgi:PAS domain S-box-containing protein